VPQHRAPRRHALVQHAHLAARRRPQTATARSSVVLPAPFGPINPSKFPASNSIDTQFTAIVLSNATDTRSIASNRG
jgi:hypothetical protein